MCEYAQIYVDRAIADETAAGREVAEPMRRALLELAAIAFSNARLRIVDDREDAFWILTASYLVGPNSVGIFVELSGAIELQHHLYIAEFDPSGFRYRGELGGNHYIEIFPGTRPEHYAREVGRAVQFLWDRESEQLAALCAMAEQLRREGWIGIDELRVELVEEMRRLRKARLDAQRSRRLELEVEDDMLDRGSE